MSNHDYLEEHIQRLNRVYSFLSNTNKSIVRTPDKESLFKELCHIACKDGQYVLAWIGKLNIKTNKVEVLASAGIVEYTHNLDIDLGHESLRSGPSGIALKSGKHFVSMDIEHDGKMEPWRERALQFGIRSSIAMPLKVFGEIYGIFNLYSGVVGHFDLDEIKLLNDLANNISFKIESIYTEAGRKKSERKLRLSKERIRLLLDSTAQGIYGVDMNGMCTFANAACLKVLGYETEEALLGKHIHTLIHHTRPDGTPSGGKLFRNIFPLIIIIIVIAGLIHFRVENEGMFDTRVNISIYITSIIIVFTIILYANSRAISQSELELLNSNERYNLVAKATHDSIWDMNIQTGEINRSGEGFKLMFGYHLEQYNNAHFHYTKLIHPDDLYRVVESMKLAHSNVEELYWEVDYRFLKSNGEYAHVHDKGYIIRDKHGAAIRMIGATQDMTEIVKYIKTIEERNKQLQEIAWTQSHIVRAPLARLIGLVNLLDFEGQVDAETNQLLKYTLTSARELDGVIKSIVINTQEIGDK